MTTTTTLRVKPVEGERFKYWVQSEGNPSLCHTVDLAQCGGLGCCTCEHYNYKVVYNQQAALRLNSKPQVIEYLPHAKKQKEGVTQCRHIWGAERQLMRNNVRPFLAEFLNGDPPTKEEWRRVLHVLLK